MTDGIGHGQHGQAERQGDAQQADPHIGEGGSQHGAPAAPSTSQKVPINSAAKGFTLVSPDDDEQGAQKGSYGHCY